MLINLKKIQGRICSNRLRGIRESCLILGMLLSLGGTVSAEPARTDLLPSGPYVGIEGGVNHLTSDVNEQITAANSDKLTLGGTGFIGNFLLGWDYFYNQWYAGVEGFVGFNTAKDEKDSLIDNTNDLVARRELKQQYQFGGALHLGRQIDNTLLFLRLGVIWSEFKLSREQFLAGVNQNDKKSQTKILAGFQPGFGVAVKLSDCLMFNTLFTYSFFQSHSVNRFEVGTTSDKPILTIKPRSMAFTVGLKWYFSDSMKSWAI